MQIITKYWFEQGRMSSDMATLARTVGVPLPKFKRLWQEMVHLFVIDQESLRHPELDKELSLALERRRKAQASARKRWAKKQDRPAADANAPEERYGRICSSPSPSPSPEELPTAKKHAAHPKPAQIDDNNVRNRGDDESQPWADPSRLGGAA